MHRDGRNQHNEPDEPNQQVEFDGDFAALLPGALGAAAESFPGAAPDLVRRAAVRGRRMRRVRVAQVATATAAAVTLSLVGVNVVASAGNGVSPNGVAQGAEPAEAASNAPAAPTAPAAAVAAPSLPEVSDAEMAATLKNLMPRGGSVSDASGSGSESDPLTAQLRYHKGGGVSSVDVSLARASSGSSDGDDGRCLPIEVRPYDVCTTKTLPNGSVLTVTRSFTHPNSTTGQKLWSAVLTTPDHVRITLEEYGGGGEKETMSGVKPLLSTGELTAVVTSTQWNKAIQSLPGGPTDTPAPPADPGVPSGPKMRALLDALLPGHAARTDWSTGDGEVQVVYDDGHGRSAIGVNVQVGMGDVASDIMSCSGGHSQSCSTSTLPDGTEIRLTEEPSEKGGKAVVWQADTLRLDGRRVVVREINSYAEAGPVTRPHPALTMNQLRTIALSPQWWDQGN